MRVGGVGKWAWGGQGCEWFRDAGVATKLAGVITPCCWAALHVNFAARVYTVVLAGAGSTPSAR